MICEICGGDATHTDSVPDAEAYYVHGHTPHRIQYLCPAHALRHRRLPVARVTCLHNNLDSDGCCKHCGAFLPVTFGA